MVASSPADPGQTLLVYTAEPNSASHDAPNRLASWTSMRDKVPAVQAQKEA